MKKILNLKNIAFLTLPATIASVAFVSSSCNNQGDSSKSGESNSKIDWHAEKSNISFEVENKANLWSSNINKSDIKIKTNNSACKVIIEKIISDDKNGFLTIHWFLYKDSVSSNTFVTQIDGFKHE